MKRRTLIVLASLAISITIVGCDDSKSAPESVSTAPTAEEPAAAAKVEPKKAEPKVEAINTSAVDARVAFPDKLGDYKFESWKTKTKDWGNAYSSTYKDKSKDELKVIINDAPPSGRTEWAVFFKDGHTLKDKPMAIDAKPGKVTLMIRVGDRYRVDFKTRSGDEKMLRKVAEAFDFGKVRTLSK